MANKSNAQRLIELIELFGVTRADVAECLRDNGFPSTNKSTIDSWLAPDGAANNRNKTTKRGRSFVPGAGLTTTKINIIEHWLYENFEPLAD